MQLNDKVQHVYLVGAKSLGAYGGYETFVYKLTEYHQNKENIKYHVACKANGDGCMDESKFEGVTKINDHEFELHNAVIARFARVFGADKKHDTKAMSQFMDKAVLGEDIILKSKGQQRYSYCYIADAVSGLFKLLLDGQDGEAYNISDDDEGLTLGEYAEYIASLANLKVRYEIENNESVSKATYALLDTRKIKNIGWEPQYSVKDGLKRTYTIKKETLGSM